MSAQAITPARNRSKARGRGRRVGHLAGATLAIAGVLLSSALPATAAQARAGSATVSSATTSAGTIVLRPGTKTMPSTWQRSFVIPYGTSKAKLGVGLEGDGDGLKVGPNYGAQAPDGTWWFVDTHKFRFAHYSQSGTYLGAVSVPERFRVNGRYFPHQLPRVLSDGTLVAGRVADGFTELLKVKDGKISRIKMNREATFRADDGRKLYGFDWNGPMVAGDPTTGKVAETKYFRARNGSRYRVTVNKGKLRVRLPDATPAVDRTWNVTTADGKPLIAAVEVATAADGTLHLLLTGFEDKVGAKDLTAYTTISPKGKLGRVERTIAPFGPSDPGSPSRLGVRPKRSSPWLMFVREDGVHVYQRTAS